MPGTALWSKPHPNKKRKFNGPQDSQQQTRYPRIDHVVRPPQGPRIRHDNVVTTHFTSQRVEYHDEVERSSSRGHARSPWGTSSEGTPSANFQSQSEYFQREMACGRRNYYRQQYPETSSIQPKIEESTQDQVSPPNRANNGDGTMDDVSDVDSNDIAIIRLDTPLPMADPTSPSPYMDQDDDLYRNDSVMDTDDALHEAGTPVDNVLVPVVGDQASEHWEDVYELEEPTKVLLEPPSAPPLATASAGTLDSIFNVPDDTMADVTDNPWTSS